MTQQSQTQEVMPKCPQCSTARHVTPLGFHRFYCAKCRGEFEDVDDGVIGRGRPDRNAENREAFLMREQERRKRRMAGR